MNNDGSLPGPSLIPQGGDLLSAHNCTHALAGARMRRTELAWLLLFGMPPLTKSNGGSEVTTGAAAAAAARASLTNPADAQAAGRS